MYLVRYLRGYLTEKIKTWENMWENGDNWNLTRQRRLELTGIQRESWEIDQTLGVYTTGENNVKNLKCWYPIFIYFRVIAQLKM